MNNVRRVLLILIGGASIAFMAYALFAGWETILAALERPAAPAILARAVAVYILAAALLGLGSAVLARMLLSDARYAKIMAVFFLAQAARYLPGNIAHLVGRITLSKEVGLDRLAASTALAIELVTLAAVAALAALYLAPQLVLAEAVLWPVAAAAAGLLGLGIGLFLLVRHMPKADRFRAAIGRLAEHAGNLMRVRNVPYLLGYLVIAALCFILLGVFLRETLRVIDPASVSQLDILRATVVFATAWLFGFLTPGAPAGIGAREAALVLLLSPIAGREVSLAVAVLSRALSVLGDGIITLIGAALYAAARERPLKANPQDPEDAIAAKAVSLVRSEPR